MAEKKQKDYADMTVKELTKLMAGPSQLKRKNAAKQLHLVVKENPEEYKKLIPDFIDALARPEAQTRWESLDALTLLVPYDTKSCKPAIEGAEEALFDEKTSLIRESAIRFLSRYGATSMKRSKEVWPLIKDALQQFHGEIDYDKMLNRVHYFATGKLDPQVKKEFRAVVKDIYNSVGGGTKVRLNRILLSLKGQKLNTAKKNTSSKKAEVKKPAKSTEKVKKTKKTTSKKDVPKKKSPKKVTDKKTNTKKQAVKKVTSKVASTKKAASKKPDTKKASAKKATAKKSTAKKATSQKVATKKASTKKTQPKKKIENKKKEVQKKVVKKAVKTATAKPKAKTNVGKRVEKKKKDVAKKVVKKAAKKNLRSKIKKVLNKSSKKTNKKK